jgi:MFS transporter, OFA family, oxalate/formate antiporter
VYLCALGIALIGFSGGAESDTIAYQAARFFGRRHFSAINGLLLAITVGAGGIGPVLAGAARDRTGNYDLAFWGGSAVFLLAAILIGTVRSPVTPIRSCKDDDLRTA